MVDHNAVISKSINSNGYIWKLGYLIGLFYKLTSKTKFQIYSYNSNYNYILNDIWFRQDTIVFFFLEIFIVFIKKLSKKLTLRKKL
jgi:hypothetical protein